MSCPCNSLPFSILKVFLVLKGELSSIHFVITAIDLSSLAGGKTSSQPSHRIASDSGSPRHGSMPFFVMRFSFRHLFPGFHDPNPCTISRIGVITGTSRFSIPSGWFAGCGCTITILVHSKVLQHIFLARLHYVFFLFYLFFGPCISPDHGSRGFFPELEIYLDNLRTFKQMSILPAQWAPGHDLGRSTEYLSPGHRFVLGMTPHVELSPGHVQGRNHLSRCPGGHERIPR